MTLQELVDQIESAIQEGFSHYKQGRYDAALQNFIGALEVVQGVQQQLQAVADVQREISDYFLGKQDLLLNNIGVIYRARGELGKALSYFQQARVINQKIAPNSTGTAGSLNNIGAIYQARGELGKALSYLQQALVIDLANAPASLETARDLGNIGVIYRARGELGKARDHFQLALVINQKIAPNSTETATNLNNIGAIYQERSELDTALSYLQQALVINQKIAPNSTGTADGLNNIGFIYRARGELDTALDYYQQAVTVLETIRSNAGDSTGRESFLASRLVTYHALIKAYLERDQAGDSEAAFIMAERTRARTLAERIQQKGTPIADPLAQALLQDEKELLVQRDALHQRMQHPELFSDEEHQADRSQSAQLENALRQIEGRLRREFPTYGALGAEVVPVKTVRGDLLDPSTLLLSFCATNTEIFGWAIRQEGAQMFLVGSLEQINPIISAAVGAFHLQPRFAWLRHALFECTPADRLAIQAALNEAEDALEASQAWQAQAWPDLSQVLWQQIQPELRSGVQRVIVLPDGELNGLPFELLPLPPEEVRGEQRLLGDLYPISYAPSATVLKTLHDLWQTQLPLPFEEKEFLGFGAPDFGNSRYGPLPKTREAVQEIARHFSCHAPFFDGDVTHANLDLHLDKASVLHGATHGVFDNDDPFGSGLVLANGHIWSARQLLARRNRLRVELLVAAACDTGRGQSRVGEGLTGFSSALLASGVRCAIVSLWPVDDYATRIFMKAFYAHWVKHYSVEEALAEARKTLKTHVIARYHAPYYWAGFIALGFATPLPTAPSRVVAN